MEKKQFDIAIIGGGLAGLCFSILAANSNFSVVLFEKEEYPFHKVCGEYISNESFDFLQRLGLNLANLDLPKITTLQLSDASGKAYNFKLPLGGFGISRYTLDHALFQIAKENGVFIHTGTKVNKLYFQNNTHHIQTDEDFYQSKIAIGSFGKRSNFDVKWNRNFISEKLNSLNNLIGVKYHIRHQQDKGLIALHNFKDGYCGISQIEDEKFCLCYLTTANNLRANNNSIKSLEHNVLAKNPLLKDIFSNATFLYDSPLVISQISFQEKSLIHDHALMVGDAAGMITPLCGNGMSMAMHASLIAFNCAQLFLKGNIARKTFEKKYAQEWKANFYTRLNMGRLVQKMFGNNRTTGFFLQTMHYMPWLAKKIIQLTHGKPF